METVRILIADDHAIVAVGLEAFLKEAFELVGTVHDGEALVEAAIRLKPDVIVTDISMPRLDGLDAVRRLKAQNVTAKVIVLTMHPEPEFAQEAFEAGASGYVLKSSAGEELFSAIHEVIRGNVYVTPLITKDLLSTLLIAKEKQHVAEDKRRAQTELTARQREVVELIAKGKTMKEVAGILGISTRTAESYKYKIMDQIGVATTAELIQYAVRLGLAHTETQRTKFHG